MRALIAVAFVWVILFTVPFAIYGSASAFLDLKPPSGPAWRFLSVAITKFGTAIGIVALFALGLSRFRGHWLRYAAIWFLMFAISEIADLAKGGYGAAEAALGILSEVVYAPLSAFVTDRLLGRAPTATRTA